MVVSWLFMVFGWFPLFLNVDSWFYVVFGWFPCFVKVVSWFFMVFGWFPWFFKVVSCKWHLISQGNPDQDDVFDSFPIKMLGNLECTSCLLFSCVAYQNVFRWINV